MVWILKYISLPKIGHGVKNMGYLIKKQNQNTLQSLTSKQTYV